MDMRPMARWAHVGGLYTVLTRLANLELLNIECRDKASFVELEWSKRGAFTLAGFGNPGLYRTVIAMLWLADDIPQLLEEQGRIGVRSASICDMSSSRMLLLP